MRFRIAIDQGIKNTGWCLYDKQLNVVVAQGSRTFKTVAHVPFVWEVTTYSEALYIDLRTAMYKNGVLIRDVEAVIECTNHINYEIAMRMQRLVAGIVIRLDISGIHRIWTVAATEWQSKMTGYNGHMRRPQLKALAMQLSLETPGADLETSVDEADAICIAKFA